MATTLLEEDITVTISNDSVFINDALVTVTDIEACNGVVHVIDAVLLPPSSTSVDIISAEQLDISVFPNPTTNWLNIQIHESDVEFERFELKTLSGQVIMQRTFAGKQLKEDVSRLAKGIYLISLSNSSYKYVQKVMIK